MGRRTNRLSSSVTQMVPGIVFILLFTTLLYIFQENIVRVHRQWSVRYPLSARPVRISQYDDVIASPLFLQVMAELKFSALLGKCSLTEVAYCLKVTLFCDACSFSVFREMVAVGRKSFPGRGLAKVGLYCLEWCRSLGRTKKGLRTLSTVRNNVSLFKFQTNDQIGCSDSPEGDCNVSKWILKSKL